MRVVAIVQARMGSTRLPGKVLMRIAGKPMLARVMERVERMRHLDDLCVATSTLAQDDEVEALCRAHGWHCTRGSASDVLGRYARAAQELSAKQIVRITADCPLLGWHEADQLIARHLASGADYTHNATFWHSGMPLGTGAEIFGRDVLEAAAREAQLPAEREHVTEWIHAQAQRYSIERLDAPEHLRRPHYRLTVDHASDLALVNQIHWRLGAGHGPIELARAVALLDRDPLLAHSNVESPRRAG